MTTMTDQKAEAIKKLEVDGFIDPAAVVEEARNPKSILHGDFQWDDEKAAEAHRLDQAKSLIKLIRVEITVVNETVLCPYYVVDPGRSPKTVRYVPITRAQQQRETARGIVVSELSRMARALERAQAVSVVLGLEHELTEWLHDLEQLRAKLEAQSKARASASAKKASTSGRRSKAKA